MKKNTKKQQKEEDKIYIDKIYQFTKAILDIPKDMALDRTTFLRLKGLATGQFICNKKQSEKAKYTYKEVFYALYVINKKTGLHNIMKTKEFNDYSHKVNYFFKVVDKNFNNIMENIKKQQEQQKINESIAKPETLERSEIFENKNLMGDVKTIKERNKKMDRFKDLF